ncbi:MAG TPA: hypothetical protein VFP15_04465 [Gemmatimonadaceae bacterium]|nr:hypothetical protein [Gemmatimonadaceae bacterium]
MSASDLSDRVQQLVSRHMDTMDHVALLLALRENEGQSHTANELAASSRLDRDVVEKALRDLVSAHLARDEGGRYRFAPVPDVRAAVDDLAELYRTRPVTLVRAIYDRPLRAAQSFADAFRLRKQED